VYHCHILAHEEMDMMHGMAYLVPPKAPGNLAAAGSGTGASTQVVLTWTDNSANETGFTLQRATNTAFTTGLTTFQFGPNVVTYTDIIGSTTQQFYYRLFGSNKIGDSATPGFPVMTAKSAFSNTAAYPPLPTPPAAPSNVTVTATRASNVDRVSLTWTDNASNETGFNIQYATNPTFSGPSLVTNTVGVNSTSFTLGRANRFTTYYFRVQSYNSLFTSAWVNASPFPITTP